MAVIRLSGNTDYLPAVIRTRGGSLVGILLCLLFVLFLQKDLVRDILIKLNETLN